MDNQKQNRAPSWFDCKFVNRRYTTRYSNAWQWEKYSPAANNQAQGQSEHVPTEEDSSALRSNSHDAEHRNSLEPTEEDASAV